jgi:hypothetical protein
VQIVAAQATADSAVAVANTTSTQIYNVDLGSKIYTDNKIQQLRDELSGSLTNIQNYLELDIPALIDQDVAAALPSMQTALDAKIMEAQTIYDDIQASLGNFQTVTSQILDVELPAQLNELTLVGDRITAAQTQLDQAFTDFPYPTVWGGFDELRAENASNIISLGNSILKAPAVQWTRESTSAVFSPKLPALPTWFLTDDPEFGDCAELPLGGNMTIGPAYPIDFVYTRVYRISVRVRAVNDGSLGGVDLALGISTWKGQTPLELNVEKALTATPLTVADGEEIYAAYFSGSSGLISGVGLAIGNTATDEAVVLSGSNTANKAFLHLRQNSQADTNGQIRIAAFKIEDVTLSFAAYQSAAADKTAAELAASVADNARALAELAWANAETAQSFAEDSATVAAQSADAAGQSASAASTSADAAQANATAAGESAAAASISKTAAETSAGNALASETAAAVSETNAQGSSNTAGTSATLAVESRYAAEEAVTVAEVSVPGLPAFMWTDSSTSTAVKNIVAPSRLVIDDVVFGKAYHTPVGANHTLGQRNPTPYIHGRIYEVTYRYRVIDDGSDNQGCRVTYGVSFFEGGVAKQVNVQSAQVVRTVADGVIEERVQFATVTDLISSPDYSVLIDGQNATANEAFFHIRANAGSLTFGAISINQILIKDVTEQVGSMSSAQASAESATLANAGATAAGEWASAADTSRINAQTAQTNAETAEFNAVAAAEDAEDARALAVSAKETAVSVASQGIGALRDMFMPWSTEAWELWTTAPSVLPNEQYPTGNTLSWNIGAVNAGAVIRSDNAAWSGLDDADGYKVEIDFELVSGNILGAGVLVDWVTTGTGGGLNRTQTPMQDMVVETIVPGKRYIGSLVIKKPDGVLGTFSHHTVYLMANFASLGGVNTKHLKVHRFQIYPMTLTEASVIETAQAVADLEGNAAASYTIRLGAGGASAGFEIVAADDPINGPVSALRFNADNIIANGTITAPKIGIVDLSKVFSEDFTNADAIDAWVNYNGQGSVTLVSTPDSILGGNVLRVGNNSGDDQGWLINTRAIPFDPDKLYRARVRVRRTAGTGVCYFGVAGVAADGITLVNTLGGNSVSSQHYFIAAGVSPDSSFTEYVGYLHGFGAPVGGGAGTRNSPYVMNSSVRYMRPLAIVNYNALPGIVDIDSFVIEEVIPGELIVDGAVVAEKIGAKAITAEKLAVGAVAASKIAIGSFDNLNIDADFKDPEAWSGSVTWQASNNSVSWGSTNVARLAGGSTSYTVATSKFIFDVDPAGEKIFFRYFARIVTGSGSVFADLQINTKPDFSGTNLYRNVGLVNSTSITEMSGVIDVPAGYRYARIRLIKNNNGTTDCFIGGVYARRMNGGKLIVDGGIAANHVDTGSFGAAGLALFGGAVQSSNFVSGSTGWQINQNGNAELNNLILRNSLVDGSVSDGGLGYALAAQHKAHNGTVTSASTGINKANPDTVYAIGLYGEHRDGWDAPTETPHTTRLLLQYRLNNGSSWGSWITLYTGEYNPGRDQWLTTTYTTEMILNAYNAEFKVMLQSNFGVIISTDQKTNVREVRLSIRGVKR